MSREDLMLAIAAGELAVLRAHIATLSAQLRSLGADPEPCHLPSGLKAYLDPLLVSRTDAETAWLRRSADNVSVTAASPHSTSRGVHGGVVHPALP